MLPKYKKQINDGCITKQFHEYTRNIIIELIIRPHRISFPSSVLKIAVTVMRHGQICYPLMALSIKRLSRHSGFDDVNTAPQLNSETQENL